MVTFSWDKKFYLVISSCSEERFGGVAPSFSAQDSTYLKIQSGHIIQIFRFSIKQQVFLLPGAPNPHHVREGVAQGCSCLNSSHAKILKLEKLTMVDMPSFIPRVRSMYSPATIMMKLSRKPKPMKGRELWYASCRNSPGVGLSERDCRESTCTISWQSTEHVWGPGRPFSTPWGIFFVLLHWVSEWVGQLVLWRNWDLKSDHWSMRLEKWKWVGKVHISPR